MIMGTIVSLITSLTIVYSTVYSDADQGKHQSSASLAFVWGIHRGQVNSAHKWPVTRKMFPFDDVIMYCRILLDLIRHFERNHLNNESILNIFNSHGKFEKISLPAGGLAPLGVETYAGIAMTRSGYLIYMGSTLEKLQHNHKNFVSLNVN